MQFRGYIDLGNHGLICSNRNNLTADSKLLSKEAIGHKNGNLTRATIMGDHEEEQVFPHEAKK
jgi:hypothetical protein